MIFSDSLSALQGLGKLKIDHPLRIQIQDQLHKINADQKEIVLCGFLDMLVFEEMGLRTASHVKAIDQLLDEK